MKMKKSLLLVSSFLSLSALAGCSLTPGVSGDTLRVTVFGKSEEDTMYYLIDEYRKLPGNEEKKFVVYNAGDGVDSYVKNAFLNDDLCDVIQVFDFNCEYFTNHNNDGRGTSLLIPLTEFMQADGIREQDYFSSVIEMTKCRTNSDDMYWVPRDYNKVVCAYNKQLFDAAGVNYPQEGWTWTQFKQTLQALKDNEEAMKIAVSRNPVYPADLNLKWEAVHYPLLKSFGGELIERSSETCFGDTTQKVTVAKEAYKVVLDLVKDGLIFTPPKDDKVPFTNKQAAMMFITRPNLSNYIKGIGEGNIDFVSLPTYDTGLPEGSKSYIGMGCTGYGITTSCPKNRKDQAWDFLKFIFTEPGQNAFSASGNGVPCLKSLAYDENAIWRQYGVTESYHPHHEVFVANEDRDLPMNFMKGFKTDSQLRIYNLIKAYLLHEFASNYKISDAKYDEIVAKFKKQMEDTWKK